jgi:DNA-directed RNA polymerase specialized sigma24 family protein
MDPDATRTYDPFGEPTRWTLIRSLTDEDEVARSEKAWHELVERYRDPIRKAVRRQVWDAAKAEEIADDFFAYLFERRVIPKIDPDEGRFRCYIQRVLRRYVLASLPRTKRARIIGVEDLDFAADSEENEATAAEESEWAATVLRNASKRLDESDPRDGTLLWRAYGIPPHTKTDRATLREESGLSKAALDTAIHRARLELGRLILREIRDTVSSERDLAEEIEILKSRLLSAHPDLLSDFNPGS